MARRKSKRRTRGTSDTSNQRLRSVLPSRPSPVDLRLFEDRRHYHPDPVRPANSFTRTRHRLKLYTNQPRQSSHSPSRINVYTPSVAVGVGFDRPRRVLVCVRRKQRREVIFAKNKHGKSGQKKPKFNRFSKVRCR